MQGDYKILVVIKAKKNKTNIKHWVVSVMSLNHAHWVTFECRISVFAWKTQTNSFNFRCVGNQFIFFGLLRHFFQGWWTHMFWARPLKMAFFSTIVLRFGCVLEETHGTTYLEVVREVLKEGQQLEVNVIELYVIES